MASFLKRRRLNRTVAFDGAPVFHGHALMLTDARQHGWSGKVVSADRREGVAEKYGKLSQVALWAGWIAHRVGFNPANPPGRSTHELRSDGIAYAGPPGRPLAWWQLGIDATEAIELRTVLVNRGYAAFRPYSDPREAHHVNLSRSPSSRLHVLQKRARAKAAERARKAQEAAQARRRKRMKISARGVEFIADFEGFRAEPYRDPVGVWTIGYGHTGGVSASSKPLTRAQARALLRDDLATYAKPVRVLAVKLKLDLTQNQFDALTSAVYNLGPGVLGADRSLGRAIRLREPRGVAEALLLYDKAGSPPVALAGLTRRRRAEHDLYLKK